MPAVATALFALVVIAFVAVSRRVGRLHLTAPIVFTLIGYTAGLAAGTSVDAAVVRAIAEATLAVVLFHDAAQVRPAQLRGDVGLCLRLLLVGLPLTILLGAGTAHLLLPPWGSPSFSCSPRHSRRPTPASGRPPCSTRWCRCGCAASSTSRAG